MDTTALPISPDSLARNFFSIRENHEKRKLFFKIGDEVHVIRKRQVLNGIIKNYDGRQTLPYEIFMLDGTIQRFTISNIRVGHVKTVRESKTNCRESKTNCRQKQPNLVIVHSSEPVVVSFD